MRNSCLITGITGMVGSHLADYLIENNKFVILDESVKVPLNIFGTHNLYNLEAAKSVCLELGLSKEQFYSSIKHFNGADKRLSLIKTIKNI